MPPKWQNQILFFPIMFSLPLERTFLEIYQSPGSYEESWLLWVKKDSGCANPLIAIYAGVITPQASLKQGLIGPKNMANENKRLCMLFGFFKVLLFFLWVPIIPKWLIKAPGHIAILFWSLLKLPKKCPKWTLGPLIYYRNTLANIRKYGIDIVFVNLGI